MIFLTLHPQGLHRKEVKPPRNGRLGSLYAILTDDNKLWRCA